jgi:TfoX/Sxy family transcriptional regulator of competence genes
MAFSESLAGRIRGTLAQTPAIEEKKMFGSVGFMLHGNFVVGVWQHSLIVRLGAEEGEAALRESRVREFDVTGRPMRGWALVDPEGVEHDDQLNGWIERAMMFVRTLPEK